MPQEPEINRTLKQLLKGQETIIANQLIIMRQGKQMLQGETDLKTAVTQLVTFAQTTAQELTTLQAAAIAAAGDPDADIEQFSQTVTAAIATIQAAMPAPATVAAVTATVAAAPVQAAAAHPTVQAAVQAAVTK